MTKKQDYEPELKEKILRLHFEETLVSLYFSSLRAR